MSLSTSQSHHILQVLKPKPQVLGGFRWDDRVLEIGMIWFSKEYTFYQKSSPLVDQILVREPGKGHQRTSELAHLPVYKGVFKVNFKETVWNKILKKLERTKKHVSR